MKVNADNANISPSNKSIDREIKDKAKELEQEDSGIKYKDRVELSGDATAHTQKVDKKNNLYPDNVNNDESHISKSVTNVSQNEKISEQKLSEIKERIAKGFYDTEEVIDSVTKLIFQNVKKIDKNI